MRVNNYVLLAFSTSVHSLLLLLMFLSFLAMYMVLRADYVVHEDSRGSI